MSYGQYPRIPSQFSDQSVQPFRGLLIIYAQFVWLDTVVRRKSGVGTGVVMCTIIISFIETYVSYILLNSLEIRESITL